LEDTPRASALNVEDIVPASVPEEEVEATPVPYKSSLIEDDMPEEGEGGSDSDDPNSHSALRRYLASEVAREDVERAHERTPLLGGGRDAGQGILSKFGEVKRRMKKVTPKDVARACVVEPVKTLPSVILGLLLNVLDGVSYGMIL
jgi:SulP family sulfate permease